MEEGAVDALVAHLCPPSLGEGEGPVACEHEVEKDAAFALGLLAVKVNQLPVFSLSLLPVVCTLMAFLNRELSKTSRSGTDTSWSYSQSINGELLMLALCRCWWLYYCVKVVATADEL